MLAADKDTAQAIEGLLTKRTQALQIREVSYDLLVHPQHDPGCLLQSGGILSSFATSHKHALVVFDREGCGRETSDRTELEEIVESDLKTLWGNRIAAIVNDPEIENWVWSPSPHVPSLLGWKEEVSIPAWLGEQGFIDNAKQIKPLRPKEAMDAVLRKTRKPHSSAIFRELAEKVSLTSCSDPAFQKLANILKNWFPRPAKQYLAMTKPLGD